MSFISLFSPTLVRQTLIKAGDNRFKTQREHWLFMTLIKRSLIKYLELGLVSNSDKAELLSKISASTSISKKRTEVVLKKEEPQPKVNKPALPPHLPLQYLKKKHDNRRSILFY
ncbi:hypothetical protein HPE56_00025 [Maribacter sp. ANRC-HE7]|uniref:Uncharacterized protein n=1 Tax=Maribacter aquimaris TaxID=2737171 RepID=A0ABR7UYR9_9FLAO|nr:hypothetical protein [Maribacter aquimaris]MBD0776166.1 hypothetical protein [Maribacter aquimaris]